MLYHQNSLCDIFLQSDPNVQFAWGILLLKMKTQWDRCGDAFVVSYWFIWGLSGLNIFRFVRIKSFSASHETWTLFLYVIKYVPLKIKRSFIAFMASFFKLFLMFYSMKSKSTFFFLNLRSKTICRLSDAKRLSSWLHHSGISFLHSVTKYIYILLGYFMKSLQL